jgi:hypothetical protein
VKSRILSEIKFQKLFGLKVVESRSQWSPGKSLGH